MKKDTPIQVGSRLKSIRRALGLTQKEFAASLDISASYLSEIESGKTKPGFNFTVLVYEKYNVNPAWFLVEEEGMFLGDGGGNNSGDFDFGGQTNDVMEMLNYMTQSPFVQSTVLSHFMKFLYENEAIIKKDIEKNKDKK
ncbi:MAG: helix-turn-helix transcriptional regulator [bacterium]|nr:helix-turn-helix transcriptional regulator [bacterium]